MGAPPEGRLTDRPPGYHAREMPRHVGPSPTGLCRPPAQFVARGPGPEPVPGSLLRPGGRYLGRGWSWRCSDWSSFTRSWTGVLLPSPGHWRWPWSAADPPRARIPPGGTHSAPPPGTRPRPLCSPQTRACRQGWPSDYVPAALLERTLPWGSERSRGMSPALRVAAALSSPALPR